MCQGIIRLRMKARHSLGVAVLLAGSVSPQGAWSRQSVDARTGHAMVFDPIRQRCVMFGGATYRSPIGRDSNFIEAPNVTLEWDGHAWHEIRSTRAPSPRVDHAMCWDPTGSRVLLFGGIRNGGAILGDTWAWDGTDWTQLQPPNAPSPRWEVRMEQMPTRGRVVLFGGRTASASAVADTWEWDGTNWTSRTPASSPAPRSHQSMTYDPVRDRIVLLGGWFSGSFVPNTWEWDGLTWALRETGTMRARHSAGFLPWVGRVVAFGGNTQGGPGSTATSELLAWNGASWTALPATTRPEIRSAHAMACDTVQNVLVAHGGSREMLTFDSVPFGDQWVFDSRGWTFTGMPTGPVRRVRGAMAFHAPAGQMVLFGGEAPGGLGVFADTWIRDTGQWRRIAPAFSPTGRVDASMAFDPSTGLTTLHSGRASTSSAFRNDTWAWDGTSWRELQLAVRPPVGHHGLVTDHAAGRLVLFVSGTPQSTPHTWEFRSGAWTPLAVGGVVPSARSGFAMEHDPVSSRTLLFGGWDTGGRVADTWAFDGSSWSSLSTTSRPSPGDGARMVFDPVRGRVRLFGVRDSFQHWEWSGADWVRARDLTTDVPVFYPVAGFDPIRGAVVMVGASPSSSRDGVMHFEIDEPASFAAYGSACNGSTGVPRLEPVPWSLPYLGDRIALEVGPLPAVTFVAIVLGDRRVDIPLAILGMPGCSLLTTVLDTVPVPLSQGVARWSATLPTDPALSGARITTQAFVADAGANALGWVSTQGGELRIR
jgi:hypothetical protein